MPLTFLLFVKMPKGRGAAAFGVFMEKKKTRIAVFCSGGGTNLQALLDAEKSGVIQSGKICLVLANSRSA